MPDIGKVRTALEACADDKCRCEECPYHDENWPIKCVTNMSRDALEVIRGAENAMRLEELIRPVAAGIADRVIAEGVEIRRAEDEQ